MDWDAIGAISEAIGAMAVVISLIYVGTQIRHNTKTSRDEAVREIYVATGDQFTVMADPVNAQCVLKGLDNYGDLSSEEKYRFDNLMCALINLVESSVMSNDADLLQDESVEAWAHYLGPRYFTYPGMHDWWKEARMVFAPSTQAWIDREIERRKTEDRVLGGSK